MTEPRGWWWRYGDRIIDTAMALVIGLVVLDGVLDLIFQPTVSRDDAEALIVASAIAAGGFAKRAVQGKRGKRS